MKREEISNYINVAATTGLGIAGALTGGAALQAVAFLPAVAYTLCTNLLPTAKAKRDTVEKELKALIKKACISTQEILCKDSKESLAFFQYANARIEMNTDMASIADVINSIQLDLETERRTQAPYITSLDVQKMAGLFVKQFMEGLHEYPSLEEFFIISSLLDHEQRISNLEKELVSATEKKPLPIMDASDDTQFYVKKYTEALFLHRKLSPDRVISLEDVYTLSRADTIGQWRKVIKRSSYENIKDAMREFIHYIPKEPGEHPIDILFIEGQAAMGKSSLIAWLCAHYDRQDEISKEVIGDRRLITIKLRDISSEEYRDGLNLQQPFGQFYSYLFKTNERELSARKQWKEECRDFFRNTLLVLDGFDELCMVKDLWAQGKSTYFQNMSNQLSQMDCDCKVIVTTRPAYLDVESLDFPKAHLVICPFDSEKRGKWLDKYEKKQAIPEEIKQVLLRDDIEVLNGIIESPLTLYMIVAKNIRVSETSNLWDIYHQIFAEEVYKRNYEKGAPHEINQYRRFLYSLTAEIANAVSAEEHFYITIEKLLEIQQIHVLLDKLNGLTETLEADYDRIKIILEDCFGLASYFRISEKQCIDGTSKCAVEFYHNNIKDYFCCEYIWMKLERIYSALPSDLSEREVWFIRNFQNLFQYSVFLKDHSAGAKSMSILFLESKILHLKNCGRQTDFICQEIKNRYFPHFFGKMLQTGILYQYQYTGKDNILDMISCIYSAVFGIYHTIYMPYLAEGEKFSIAEKEHTVEIGTSFIYRILFPTTNIYDQSRTSFDGIMLSGISFGRHDFRGSSFRGCLMIGCDFNECDLRGTDFSFASLQYADLSGAMIDETTIFEKAELKLTKITKEQRQYMGKQQKGALQIIDD